MFRGPGGRGGGGVDEGDEEEVSWTLAHGGRAGCGNCQCTLGCDILSGYISVELAGVRITDRCQNSHSRGKLVVEMAMQNFNGLICRQYLSVELTGM